jgi:hypothetical protein
MKVLSWINFILGLWLIVAAFALTPAVGPIMAEEIVMGIVIACLAAASAARPMAATSWLIALAGLWTLIAPTVLGYGNAGASRGDDIVVGIIVMVLGIVNAVYRHSPVHAHA